MILFAGCELMLWADSYKTENGWKSPILLPLEPVGTSPEILTPIRWGQCGRRLWTLHPVFHVLERFGSSLTGKCSDGRDSTSSHCLPLQELERWWLGRHCSGLARSLRCLPHLLWILYLHSISAGFKMQPRAVSFSLQQGSGSCCFLLKFSLFKLNVESS